MAKRTGKTAKTGGIGETARFLLLLFLATLMLRSFVIAPFFIPSGSMLPSLLVGDFLFVAKWPYGYSRWSLPGGVAPIEGRLLNAVPERGDVVVFRHPSLSGEWVKRVIGLPGDRVEMREGTLWLNGSPVPRIRIADQLVRVSPNSPCRAASGAEPQLVRDEAAVACAYPRYREQLPGGRSYEIVDQVAGGAVDTTPGVRVPAGHLFVLGDNRDDSRDSRFALADGGVGLLPTEQLVGRAWILFFSTDGSVEWAKPWTWVSALRAERVGRTIQ